MKWTIKEILAITIVVLSLVGLPVLVFQNAPWVEAGELRIVHLTAVKKNGVWTDEKVTGHNYWRKSFKPVTLLLNENEKVKLRLSSSDVTHTFYVPELNIGPIKVEAGHVEEVIISAGKSGEYLYYCIIVCGECHCYMQGTVKVVSENETVILPQMTVSDICEHDRTLAENSTFLERGKEIFINKGCMTCHGENGKGGVFNYNYVNNTVPELNTLADKLKIYWQEDAEIIIELLENHVNLDSLEDNPPIENYSRFLAQYHSMLDKINDGALKLQALNSDGPLPPLYMPAWEYILSDTEIDAVLAYLIKQFDWDEEF